MTRSPLKLEQPPQVSDAAMVLWLEKLHAFLMRWHRDTFLEHGCGVTLDSSDKLSVKVDGCTVKCGVNGLYIPYADPDFSLAQNAWMVGVVA